MQNFEELLGLALGTGWHLCRGSAKYPGTAAVGDPVQLKRQER
jgi:hypothetical protein